MNNPRFPHSCKITRAVNDNPLEDEFSNGAVLSKTVYDGECRAFNRDTVSDNGDVVTSYRKLALPLKQDEWTEENVVKAGDRVEVQKFGFIERGVVVDIYPTNLGTHIIWKYARN
ncbi:MAG: hypothetical protein SOW01_07650 [Mediterranea sp.]|nr:hypothetical protein [Mediterranea sp.]